MKATPTLSKSFLTATVAASIFLLANTCSAVVLSYELAAFETTCFHETVNKAGKAIDFYYAVQTEGSEIEATVYRPNGQILHKGKREAQGDYALTADSVGDFSFCFSNAHASTRTVLEFDITVESDAMSETKAKDATTITPLESTIKKLDGDLNKMFRYQKYFKARELRNYQTVETTESRIYYFAVLECLAIVGMAFMQVYVVKTFFSTNKPVRGRI